MDIIQAIIIAIVEGLTEFLPVSSTAHMKFTNPLVGVSPTPFTNMFEIVIQLAAILSVVFAYSRKFFDFRHPFVLYQTHRSGNSGSYSRSFIKKIY